MYGKKSKGKALRQGMNPYMPQLPAKKTSKKKK